MYFFPEYRDIIYVLEPKTIAGSLYPKLSAKLAVLICPFKLMSRCWFLHILLSDFPFIVSHPLFSKSQKTLFEFPFLPTVS